LVVSGIDAASPPRISFSVLVANELMFPLQHGGATTLRERSATFLASCDISDLHATWADLERRSTDTHASSAEESPTVSPSVSVVVEDHERGRRRCRGFRLSITRSLIVLRASTRTSRRRRLVGAG